MDNLLRLIVVTFLFGGGFVFLFSISPIGKALAARITGRLGPALNAAEIEDLRALRAELEEMRDVRTEVAELAERLDFAERLLAKQRESGRLAPPS